MPFAGDHEERPFVVTPERAREAAAVELERLEHLAALGQAPAVPVRDVAVPDGSLGVEADAVGSGALAELCPDAPIRESDEVRPGVIADVT